jgi:nucleolar complex protein 3
LEFLEKLLVNEPRLQALLSADDRSRNGLYRPELDDPELSNPFASSLWELSYLAQYHSDDKIKTKSKELTMLDMG